MNTENKSTHLPPISKMIRILQNPDGTKYSADGWVTARIAIKKADKKTVNVWELNRQDLNTGIGFVLEAMRTLDYGYVNALKHASVVATATSGLTDKDTIVAMQPTYNPDGSFNYDSMVEVASVTGKQFNDFAKTLSSLWDDKTETFKSPVKWLNDMPTPPAELALVAKAEGATTGKKRVKSSEPVPVL